jgi:hypothetical protein
MTAWPPGRRLRLMLLVPADAADPARVTAHEQALADLLTAGDRPASDQRLARRGGREETLLGDAL